jgi:hypothetical protein
MKTPHAAMFVVDCEYSAVTNQLISMAIVPLWSEDMYAQSSLTELVDPDREFYEVLSTLPDVMSDWVEDRNYTSTVPRETRSISVATSGTRTPLRLV